MSFIERLRVRQKNDPLKHPVSPGFTPEQWHEAFEKNLDGSAQDHNVHQFGLFVFERLEKIREALRQIEKQMPRLSAADVLNEIVKHPTDIWRRVSGRFAERLSSANSLTMEEMHTLRHPLAPDAGGYTQPEMVEATVDALRFVVREAMGREVYGSEYPQSPVFPADQAIFSLVQTAHLYSMYERIWESVLWLDASVEWHDDLRYRVTESGSEIAKESTLSVLRRGLRHEREVRTLMSAGISSETYRERFVSVDARTGALYIKELRDFPKLLQEAILLFALQTHCAIDLDARQFVKEGRLPKSGVRIHDAINLRARLAALAAQLDMFSFTSGEIDGRSHPDNIRFKTESLSKALSHCLNLPLIYTQQALNAFIFDGSDRHQDLWVRPLVPTEGGLALISPSILTGDPMRLIAAWARNDKKLQAMHAQRGHAFAHHVHDALKFAGSRSQIPGAIAVLGPNLKIATSDIDCLLVYGSSAFVLECRTVPHAATPHEHWNTGRELGDKKTTQAIGQRDYLQANPEILRSLIHKNPGICKIDKVVAVVVSNSHMYEGTRDEEPYFVHVDTLMHVIIYGGSLFGISDEDNREQTLRANAFKGEGSPEDSFIRSIARPAKAEFYRRQLRLISNPLQALDQTEPVGSYESWVCSMPSMEEFKNNLQTYSFFDDLELLDETLPFQ